MGWLWWSMIGLMYLAFGLSFVAYARWEQEHIDEVIRDGAMKAFISRRNK